MYENYTRQEIVAPVKIDCQIIFENKNSRPFFLNIGWLDLGEIRIVPVKLDENSSISCKKTLKRYPWKLWTAYGNLERVSVKYIFYLGEKEFERGKGESRQSDTVINIQNLKMAARDHSSGIIP